MSELINKTKGKIKQSVAGLTGNQELKREGRRDERQGEIEGAVKDVKRVAKAAVKDANDTLKGISK